MDIHGEQLCVYECFGHTRSAEGAVVMSLTVPKPETLYTIQRLVQIYSAVFEGGIHCIFMKKAIPECNSVRKKSGQRNEKY